MILYSTQSPFLSFICYNSPARHPFISTAEQNYLLKELRQLQRDKNQSPTPWREMLSSKPVYALIIENATTSSKTEPICEAPEWAINQTSGTVVIDQAQYGVKYNWTQEQQGLILSSFFLGYILTHLPGGLLAQKFGGKYVLGLGITISALCSMAIPLAVQYGGLYAIITMRVLMGAFQGPIFPALIQMLSVWVPVTERAFLTSLVYSGSNIGTVIASYFSGIIMHYYSWEMVFYTFGLLAIVWFIIFSFICYNSPARHPFISTAEQNYLLKELGQLQRDKNQSPTPWREMLSSKPVYALIIAKCCVDWTYYIANTTLPKYMNDVLHLSIRDIGTFNSLPWILKTILSFAFGFIIDRLIARGKIRITNARKLAVFLASVLPAIFVILASYAECEHVMVIVFFIVTIGMHGPLTSGVSINSMDLSPNYSGVLTSVSNGASSIASFLAPYMTGVMTPNAYLSEWRLVFWVTFAVYISKTTIFIIWGSGEIQPWNASKNTNNSPLIEENSTTVKKILD